MIRLFKYKNYGLSLKNDFELRVIYEDENDIDLFIPIGNRTLNIYFDDLPEYLNQRFQLNDVENILLRLSKLEKNTLSTIHFLRSIDLKSSTLNFVIDYKNLDIEIKKDEYNNNIYIKRKKT